MQRNARTNITAAWGGADVLGVAKLTGNLIVYSFGKHLRRRRSRKSVASANLTVSVAISRLLHFRRVRRFVGRRGQRVGTAA